MTIFNIYANIYTYKIILVCKRKERKTMDKGIMLFKTITNNGWKYDGYANVEKYDEGIGLTEEEYYAQEYCRRKGILECLYYNQRKNCIIKINKKEDGRGIDTDIKGLWENANGINYKKTILTDNDSLKILYEEFDITETYGVFEFISHTGFNKSFIENIKNDVVKYINIPDTNEKVIPDRLYLSLSMIKDKIEEANRLNRIEKIQDELYFLSEFIRAKDKIKVVNNKNRNIYKLLDLGFKLWKRDVLRRMYYNTKANAKYYIDLNTNTLCWEGETKEGDIQYIYDLAKDYIEDLKKDE